MGGMFQWPSCVRNFAVGVPREGGGGSKPAASSPDSDHSRGLSRSTDDEEPIAGELGGVHFGSPRWSWLEPSSNGSVVCCRVELCCFVAAFQQLCKQPVSEFTVVVVLTVCLSVSVIACYSTISNTTSHAW